MKNNDQILGFRLVISGKIQGVGFRPFIKNLACSMNLKGEVLNSNSGVQITILGSELDIENFVNSIKNDGPRNAKILKLNVSKIACSQFAKFSIAKSTQVSEPLLIITADQTICSSCKLELNDAKNRRYRYPFISCLNCGPRFSILDDLPYDRSSTSLKSHKMCLACHKEYKETKGRRQHAQSLSCPNCAIELSLWKNAKLLSVHKDRIFEIIRSALENDQIVMVKGVSGFLLCCNANSSAAIQKLRKRKNRRSKPLAVMYPDLEYVKSNFHVSEKEAKQLASVQAPIVLLSPIAKVLPSEINFGLNKVGVLLPNSGLLQIILDDFGSPIVATSGNITNESITFRNENAIEYFKDIADLVLCHDLEINFPQDDSVVQFSPKYQRKITLRRSRGLAPEYINEPLKNVKDILAFGADLKSSITILNKGNFYMSPHLGDLSLLGTQQRYELLTNKLTGLLKHRPEILLADAMTSYHSVQLAQEYKTKSKKNVQLIPHHEAHFAAILGEHHLWGSHKNILGVIWDGTGLGKDHNIWGGEFYQWSKGKMEHFAQMEYKPWILGDKMAKEPRISAFSYFHQIDGSEQLLKNKFDKNEWQLYDKMMHSSKIKTSSMGRLFDSVASILGICDLNEFQGQAAMLLEQAASEVEGSNSITGYGFSTVGSKVLLNGILEGITKDKLKGVENAIIAYKFHLSLVTIISELALIAKTTQVAFSGGVFQNALLVDLIIQELGSKYDLFFHKHLSPNDENISFGQIMHYNNVKA